MMTLARTAGTVGVVLALLAATAAAASASRERSGSFCSVSRSVAADLAHSTKMSTALSSPARTKVVWEKIKAAEPALLGSAPARQKAQLRQVYSFVNLVVTDLTKAHWQVTNLAPYASTLEARAAAANRPLNALDHYWRTTCKLHY